MPSDPWRDIVDGRCGVSQGDSVKGPRISAWMRLNRNERVPERAEKSVAKRRARCQCKGVSASLRRSRLGLALFTPIILSFSASLSCHNAHPGLSKIFQTYALGRIQCLKMTTNHLSRAPSTHLKTAVQSLLSAQSTVGQSRRYPCTLDNPQQRSRTVHANGTQDLKTFPISVRTAYTRNCVHKDPSAISILPQLRKHPKSYTP